MTFDPREVDMLVDGKPVGPPVDLNQCGACLKGDPCLGLVLYPNGFPAYTGRPDLEREHPLFGQCPSADLVTLNVLVRKKESTSQAVVEAVKAIPGVIGVNVRATCRVCQPHKDVGQGSLEEVHRFLVEHAAREHPPKASGVSVGR